MDTNNKKTSDSNDWKRKVNSIVQTCQSELKKTTKIGMKMLSASQSNAQLHEAYEELGRWLVKKQDEDSAFVSDLDVKDIIKRVKELEDQLELFEKDVHDIKKK